MLCLCKSLIILFNIIICCRLCISTYDYVERIIIFAFNNFFLVCFLFGIELMCFDRIWIEQWYYVQLNMLQNGGLSHIYLNSWTFFLHSSWLYQTTFTVWSSFVFYLSYLLFAFLSLHKHVVCFALFVHVVLNQLDVDVWQTRWKIMRKMGIGFWYSRSIRKTVHCLQMMTA